MRHLPVLAVLLTVVLMVAGCSQDPADTAASEICTALSQFHDARLDDSDDGPGLFDTGEKLDEISQRAAADGVTDRQLEAKVRVECERDLDFYVNQAQDFGQQIEEINSEAEEILNNDGGS